MAGLLQSFFEFIAAIMQWLKNLPMAIMTWLLSQAINGAEAFRHALQWLWGQLHIDNNNSPTNGNGADVPHPEWGSGNHANKLPTGGEVPFVPPKNIERRPDGSPKPKRGGGFPDDKGRIWTWDKTGHVGEHWDVTDPKTNKHINVYPNGHIRP